MDPIQVTYWPMICDSIRSHAQAMGRMSSKLAADLMTTVAERFCSLPEPSSSAELSRRQLDQITVGGVIGTLAHADAMARMTPTAEAEVQKEMKAFAHMDLAAQAPMAQIAFGSKIGTICTSHQIRGR